MSLCAAEVPRRDEIDASSPRTGAAALDPRAEALLGESLTLAETYWDDRAALLWAPSPAAWGNSSSTAENRHLIRESGWYALGLLIRNGAGDTKRALRIIDVILRHQMRAPGDPWDGTFFRTPEEPHPPTAARRWQDYDPNWRQFVGTTLALVLIEFADRLPEGFASRIDAALADAIEGEQGEARLAPHYTNVALMHAFLWAFAGRRAGREDWIRQAGEWAEAIHTGFQKHGAFEEYNSPTYYGIDFFGLALWRRHGPTPRMRELGATLEAALWRDAAAYYHAGLQNFAGPYDRAYGMDLRKYCAAVGLPIALHVDRALAPLPDPRRPMHQTHDYLLAPLHVALDAQIPPDALAHFQSFQGERTVTRRIDDQRVATAWLAANLMIGAEATSLSRGASTTHSQFHPATVHWRIGARDVGWIALRKVSRVNAAAHANRLEIEAVGDAIWRIQANGLQAEQITRDLWQLPDLTVRLETDARDFVVTPHDDYVDVTYREATTFVLQTTHQQR